MILAFALLLDAAFGEPDWLWSRWPHPAVLMGRAIGWLEFRLNAGSARLAKGVLAVALLVLGAALIGLLLAELGALAEILVAAVLLAHRSLVEHIRAVGDGLRLSLAQGRRSVARIVSRDTAAMDNSAVARSAIESAAENFSDGVIAPAFWFLVAGLPGLIVYKVVNTADSMIGYRTPRYEAFVKAAARLDDVLNWIPARLSALLMAPVGGVPGQWREIIEDARLHRSPNAGWPEAAMARAIRVALAGPRAYDGVMQPLAWVNGSARRDLTPADIDACLRIMWRSWGLLLALTVLGAIW